MPNMKARITSPATQLVGIPLHRPHRFFRSPFAGLPMVHRIQ